MKNSTVKANEIFDLNRFSKYFVVDIQNCVNRYGLNLLLLSLFLPIVCLIVTLFRLFLHTPLDGGFVLPARLILAGIAATVMFLSSPSICYGHITDKKMGTRFLMTPASTFEKYVSMLLVCCVVIPVTFLIGTFVSDSIICLIDPNSGMSFAECLVRVDEFRNEMLDIMGSADVTLNGFDPSSVAKLTNPMLYIDDTFTGTLIFLLGALWFKQRKVAKTIAALLLVTIVLSLIVAPFAPVISDWNVKERLLVKVSSNPVLWDTMCDTLVNLVLAGLIFLRLKKISH